jgi:predicted nucleic acid-binding protein
VYHALFVELAAQQELKLATFDAELLRKFPQIARRPRLLAAT